MTPLVRSLQHDLLRPRAHARITFLRAKILLTLAAFLLGLLIGPRVIAMLFT